MLTTFTMPSETGFYSAITALLNPAGIYVVKLI